MLDLPYSTAVNKPLAKKAVFTKFSLTTTQRERFDADISRMAITGSVTPATVPGLQEGREVKSIYILTATLRTKNYDRKNILLLSRLIPQHMVFVLRYGEEEQLAVCIRQHLLLSDWTPVNSHHIHLQGLTFDTAWQHIVMEIGRITLKNGNSLYEQILENEEQTRLRKRIESLDRKCRSEQQPRRKLELFEEIQKLKLQLK